ncbi:MAG TPA: M1 family metallopeptidase [Longimicrobiales bacterium]|nr:M1 family metallopeptidase [Longimicrobiales bacterium]
MLRGALLAGVLLAAACRPAPEPVSPAPDGSVEAVAPRHFVRPLPVDSQFEAAVARGTRTRAGEPGPNYWTNRVDYRIEARLNPATAEVEGEEWVTYHNHSPDTIRTMVVRLYQNLFRPGTPKNRTVPTTGGMELRRVVVGGSTVPEMARGEEAPAGASYRIDGTVMQLRLAEPIPPAGSETLEFAWRFEVPPAGTPRHGHIDHRVYNVAQWYPQIATYDDLDGWHTWPYLGDGEFYLEYGDFDVAITLPEGWLVAATGELLNADEVLSDKVRERLAQARDADDPVHVVTREDFGAGRATRQIPGGELTWQFSAEDVRDFAFAASSEYLWDATHAIGPDSERDADAAPDTIAVHAFYTPDATHWREAAAFVRHAVAFHAEHWHPYVWPQMTGASGPVGGMEYPMLTFVAAFNSARLVYTVLNHEIGHMWYPMMVGSNEPSYPWMDEGFATYIENYANADFFGDTRDWEASARSATEALASPNHTPVMRHADLHGPSGTRGASSYHKPAMLLRSLEGIIGRDDVWRSLREYSDSWLFRHPAPADFFNLVERIAGRDLDWFWYPWFYETVGMDQAIAAVELSADGRHATVTVEDRGEAPMPVRLTFTLENGDAVQQVVPVDVWLTGARTWRGSFELAAPVAGVEIDAQQLFLDVERANNRWPR